MNEVVAFELCGGASMEVLLNTPGNLVLNVMQNAFSIWCYHQHLVVMFALIC